MKNKCNRKHRIFLKKASAWGTIAAITLTSAGCSEVSKQNSESADSKSKVGVDNKEQPNVVYIVLDDVGYSDLGCYGSSISTPNMDELARQGILYSDYYTQPMSSPSRSAILTGSEANAVGMSVTADVDMGDKVPNLNGTVYPEYGTIAESLKENGYSTMAVGKWHLGSFTEFVPDGDREQWPTGKGFDQSYCFVGSQANQLQTGGLISGDEFVLADIDSGDYHFTTDMVDTSLEYIDNVEKEQPFFLYFATGAMHGPLQAPEEYIKKYKGKFSHGWDVERENRFAKQIESGLFPEDTELPPMPEGVTAWTDLTDVEKQVAEKHMEVYAGFLEHTDMEIGRLIEELKSRDEYDNTIFTLVSDNGANSNGMQDGSPSAHMNENLMAISAEEQLELLDEYGGVEYGTQYNKGWCMASVTPFRYHKTTTFNGGLRVPCIVTWPDKIAEPGRICRDVIDSTDLTPTMLEVANVEPVKEIDGVKQHPMEGSSFAESFDSEVEMSGRINEMCFMLAYAYAYSDGEYMIANHPVTKEKEMYHMKNDPTQMHNLKEEEPEKFEELFQKYEEKKREYNAENLLMDVIQGISQEEIIERYGEVGKTVLTALRDGTVPEDVEAAEWVTMICSFTMKVGASGYVGVASEWYEAPESRHSAKDYSYNPKDGMFYSDAAAQTIAVSHTITTTIETKNGVDPEGVILANGGIDGGYSIYVKDGILTYEYNFCNERYKVESTKKINSGTVNIEYQYKKEGLFNGTGTLLINGEKVGSSPVKTLPVYSSFDYFSFGEDVGSRVSKDYNDKFSFNGTVGNVDIHLGADRWEKND